MIKKTLYASTLSDEIKTDKAVSKQQAERLFTYFKDNPLFRWQDTNNDCEDRANAICILLDEWKIQNGKSWVFSGYVLKKTGYLKNRWKYHVAALLPVKEDNKISYYSIDPATADTLTIIEKWAANVTDSPHSYYIIKNGKYYIFNPRTIRQNKWHKRNKGNYNWTMQGLSGINGVSSKGKAQLAFNKKKLLKTKRSFKELMNTPFPLS
ncbi:MAG: protein-glutamine glutaminase family protein [Ginsengibacter sp.]